MNLLEQRISSLQGQLSRTQTQLETLQNYAIIGDKIWSLTRQKKEYETEIAYLQNELTLLGQ